MLKYLLFLCFAVAALQGCLITHRAGLATNYAQKSDEQSVEAAYTFGFGIPLIGPYTVDKVGVDKAIKGEGFCDALLFTLGFSGGISSNTDKNNPHDAGKNGTEVGSYLPGVEYIQISKKRNNYFLPEGLRLGVNLGIRKTSFEEARFLIQGTVGLFQYIAESNNAISVDFIAGWLFGDNPGAFGGISISYQIHKYYEKPTLRP
ncbi:MAG: hypothetical protein JXR95_14475 [Deltaproteobacteria bacterium]|nr:hypothetical protein [Deltaproteobacteria bacterium]